MDNGEFDITLSELVDREAGILTKEQRKWILGLRDEELSPNAERQLSYRVRKRVRNSLIDFTILQWLETTHINQIFDEVHPDTAADDGRPDLLTNSIPDVFTFLMLGFGMKLDMFERVCEVGLQSATIETAARTQDELPLVSMNCNFDIEGVVPLDEIERRYGNGAVLTRDALLALVISDRIDWSDARDYPSITSETAVLRNITTDIEEVMNEPRG